jgi:hypothetical protein
MVARKLDSNIKEAFTGLGFTDSEIAEGCWLLERNGKGIAWIALHKFLERVAASAGIGFNMPTVLNCTENEVAVCVEGYDKNGNEAWSIGEASPKNCKNEYRWAMAEKRAKDRVILKLLGIAGYVYSEEEADEFKKQPDSAVDNFEKEASSEKATKTKALKKAIATGEYKEPAGTKDLETRYNECVKYLSKVTKISLNSVHDRINTLVDDLMASGKDEEASAIQKRVYELMGIEDEIL